jgi:two-component system vancomycin resistance associated response regulator VraR
MESTLRSIHDFNVMGAFSEEDELLECLRANKVDVIVLDLMLKSSKGLVMIDHVKAVQKDIKVIVLSEVRDELVIRREIEVGVNAILRKDTSYSELISCIISVAKGNDVFPSAVIEKVHDSILSETEQKVLECVADELTNDEIAKQLFISRRTVETHISNICEKLGCINRVGAVRKAMNLGLLK